MGFARDIVHTTKEGLKPLIPMAEYLDGDRPDKKFVESTKFIAEKTKEGVQDVANSTKEGIMNAVDKTTEVVTKTATTVRETVTGNEELPNFDFTPCDKKKETIVVSDNKEIEKK